MTQQLQGDKRQNTRNTSIFVQGRLTTTESEDTGYVSDLSIEGMRMLSSRAPEDGQSVALALSIPGGDDDIREVELDGLCVWRQPTHLPGYFDCGFRFSSLTHDQIKGLKALIDATGLRLA